MPEVATKGGTVLDATSAPAGEDRTHPLRLPARPAARRLLIWDAPNLQGTLWDLFGRAPKLEERPCPRALASWFAGRRDAPGEVVEACAFVNVAPRNALHMTPWVHELLKRGFWVFTKPAGPDIDEDMTAHIEQRLRDGGLREVTILSHDGKRFIDLAGRLIAAGIRVCVAVFPEATPNFCSVPGIEVQDLEQIPGLFNLKLPRVLLRNLPPAGRWFKPLISLGDTQPGASIAGPPVGALVAASAA